MPQPKTFAHCPFCDGPSELYANPSVAKTTLSWNGTGPDPNYYTRGYSCSNGHRFIVTSRDGRPDEVEVL